MIPRADVQRDYAAIRRILLEDWDPIGVREEPTIQDEYEAYAVGVYSILARGGTDADVAAYLDFAADRIGLSPGARAGVGRIVRALRALGIGPRAPRSDGGSGGTPVTPLRRA